MTRTLASTAGRLALAAVALSAVDAQAIPSFARKYGTSCQTCHTVYPKLNPFGEAFRRRGYRFPGVDADAVSEQPQPLGQEWQAKAFPKAIWPGTLPATAPLAMGFDGQAALHPDAHSGGAVADGEAPVTLHDLAGAAHLWAGGSYDQWITFLAELSFSSARGFQFETAQVHFNDLIGPPNLVNLTVGQGRASLNSFAASSSYLVDDALPAASLAGLFGASSAGPALNDDTAGVEVSGVVKGRFDYAVGVNAGSNVVMQVSDDFYAHVGLKLGGLGLDGSNTGGAADPGQPGAETALTIDLVRLPLPLARGCRGPARSGRRRRAGRRWRGAGAGALGGARLGPLHGAPRSRPDLERRRRPGGGRAAGAVRRAVVAGAALAGAGGALRAVPRHARRRARGVGREGDAGGLCAGAPQPQAAAARPVRERARGPARRLEPGRGVCGAHPEPPPHRAGERGGLGAAGDGLLIMTTRDFARWLGLAVLAPALAWAEGGTITGKVDALPARFLPETVVYLKQVPMPSPRPEPKKVSIDQKGLRFVPHMVAINVGDSVEFQNHDAVDHNVFTPDNEGYNLGMIRPSAAGSYEFKQPGVYTQLCSVHAEMLAYVFVGDNPYHAVVDAKGAFKLEHVPPGSWTIAVWNSHLKAADQTVTVAEGKAAEVDFSLKR